MNRIFLIFGMFFFMINGAIAQNIETTVSGKIENNEYYTDIYLDNLVNDIQVGSSEIDKKGKFSISFDLGITDFYKLRLDDDNYVLLILEPGQEVDLALDIENLFQPEIKGSSQSKLVYGTLDSMNNYDKKIETYTEKIKTQKDKFLRQTVLENSASLSVLFFIDQFDISEDLELYKTVLDDLKSKYPDNALVIDLSEKVRTASTLSKGSEVPDIVLPTPDGDEKALSSLKGKVVLIDFWASWCRPCIGEIPNLVKQYDKYNESGFEIYGVSLDAERESWLNAIEKYEMDWIHVSDLKYWESEVVELYGIEGIPYTILIDKKGQIIAKNLRGEELENKLQEIFE